jgi:cytoskeleton protein RodZ
VGAILAIGAYVTWYRMSGNDRPSTEVVQQVPDRLSPLVPDQSPAARTPAAQTGPDQTVPAQSDQTQSVASASPESSASVSPSAAAAATTQGVALPAVDGSRVIVRATADSWIQVRDKQGPVLFNRMLRAGDTWQVPPKTSLLLTTGNAGGTQLVVDGVVAPPLGAEGAVRRDVPLDADAIKGGKLAVNAQHPAVLPHNE